MKYISAQAIITRVREFGESDLMVTFFTEHSGRLRAVAKGAMRSRRRFVNCLDLFSLVNLEYSPARSGDLNFLHSGKLIEAFPGLRGNYSILSKAAYMIELTEILFPWELPDNCMFELLVKSLHRLDRGEMPDLITRCFEFIAMSHGGFKINLERCCACGRSYTGEGTAVFKPDKGAIACMKCHQITATSPKLSPETVRFIKLLYEDSPALFDQPGEVDEKIISEIRPVLKLHREYHLGREPKTASCME
jgi:DNA repair protein RecO (recombination protein O)